VDTAIVAPDETRSWGLGDEAWPEPERDPSGRAWLALAVVAAVLLAGMGGVVAYLLTRPAARQVAVGPGPTAGAASASAVTPSPSGSGSPAPREALAQVATTLTSYRERLRDPGGSTRLQVALDRARRCQLDGAQDVAADVVSLRQAERGQLGQLPWDQLPDGTSMRADLDAALAAAGQADEAYLRWLQGLATQPDTISPDNCPGPDPADAGAAAADRASSVAKARFLARWNPLATAAGDPPLPTFAGPDL